MRPPPPAGRFRSIPPRRPRVPRLNFPWSKWREVRRGAVLTPPIFLHSGWRTGGTALAFALAADPGVSLFYDPFNPGLAGLWDGVRQIGPSSWPSGHPDRATGYFAEYAPLVRDGRIHGASERFFDSYAMSATDDEPAQEEFLRALIALAADDGRRAVMKFEQTDGRIAWLRARFPDAVHVGLLRDPEAQFRRWLVLLVEHGGQGFFGDAHRASLAAPSLFPGAPAAFDPSSWDCLDSLFHAFHPTTERFRREGCDLVLDVAPESHDVLPDQIARVEGCLDADTAGLMIRSLQAARAGAADVRPSGWTLEALRKCHGIAVPLRGQVHELNEVVARLVADRALVDAAWAEGNAAWAAANEQVVLLDMRLRNATEALGAAEAARVELDVRLGALMRSRSWKITAPFAASTTGVTDSCAPRSWLPCHPRLPLPRARLSGPAASPSDSCDHVAEPLRTC